MENPARGGASECLTGKYDTKKFTAKPTDIQSVCRAVADGLTCLPDHRDFTAILLRSLDPPQWSWIAAKNIPAGGIGASLEVEAVHQDRASVKFCRKRGAVRGGGNERSR